ncbi:UDP-N-acetylmuramoyl-tripeptide--D-alanyl-D-alanine ligase [bacterium]|jgi:UDP-N-acetylmuramoyl-tripeptide--D-alanyl-D-alanine ligase|nr:UDP-N-acetylmuramoyl-tripeptide--D-alanyl-D-alanine ligase [bacterium]
MNISIDSRHVKPGQLFIPVKGERFDGHDFIDDVIKKGGRVLDVDLSDYARKYRKKLSCSVIGITGSSGKTTVKDMLASVLGQKYNVVKTKQNQNNEIGVPLTLLDADYSTDIIIVEMGIRKRGDMSLLSSIVRPTHVAITNIGKTHLETFKSLKTVVKEKGKVFRKPLKSDILNRHAFLNYNSFGYDDLKLKAESCEYTVTPITGETAPDQNINLCYAIGQSFGLDNSTILKGIQDFEPSGHRQLVKRYSEVVVIDDVYNSNPNGMVYALQSLRNYTGRKIVVLGDMLELGRFGAIEHRRLIPHLKEADVSMIFSVGSLVKEIQSSVCPNYHFNSKADLIKQLLQEIKTGDVVLVKGSRGMEMEIIVDKLEEHYA